MKTSQQAVINFKVDAKLKLAAQKTAEELGFSLSSIMNAYLKDLVRLKEVHFSVNDEELNEKTIRDIEESEREYKLGKLKSHTLEELFTALKI